MKYLYLLFLALVGLPLPRAEAAESGAAPPISCAISMATWCITSFDGTIELADGGEFRVWRLHERSGIPNQSMTITENKACSDQSGELIALVSKEATDAPGGGSRESYRYSLNKNGCTLEFSFPAGDAGKAYKRMMLYGVLVGYEKAAQLYRFN